MEENDEKTVDRPDLMTSLERILRADDDRWASACDKDGWMTFGIALKLLAGRGVSATEGGVIEVLSSGGASRVLEADYSDAKIRGRGRGRRD